MDETTTAGWHARAADEVVRELGTSASGLDRAEVAKRRARFGPNVLREAPPPSALELLLSQLRSPLIYVLLAAAVVTLLLQDYVDAAVIGAVLALNTAVGFVQEHRAQVSVQALMKLVSPKALVVREGHEREIESRELVPGDVVLLDSGARIPADLRLVSTVSLLVDESLLTGESLPVSKGTAPVARDCALADRSSMAFAGSVVTSGRARGVVVATGERTELGTIAREIRAEEEGRDPLQERMSRFARTISLAVAISGAAVFALGLARGGSIADMFLVAVALAVAAIPEGLPVAFTITLAVGVHRMARRNAIVRRLPAVETLGSTTVIGSDKTGTLTENRMTVKRLWCAGEAFDVPPAPPPALPPPLRDLLLASILTNEAEAYRTEDGALETHGDPTEAALLVAAAAFGLEPETERELRGVFAEIPFEPERRYSASIRECDGEHVVWAKGAPERIVSMCEEIATRDGTAPIDRGAIEAAAEALAARGLRVLAMAMRAGVEPPCGPEVEEPEGLVLLGLAGMMDPPREGVRGAIAACRSAGMRVLMITGDHAATARSIGAQLGIPYERVLTGVELARLSDAEVSRVVREISIYARAAPEQKLQLVRALRDHGEIVAVTGDGVNDAPALKAADIGVAMGRSGTDVAREASDMVLADDNFVSIVGAVEEGRVAFDNVRNVSFFLISTGAAAILSILAVEVLGWPLPYVAVQLLWLNLVTNGLQDVALAFEPGEPRVLARRPRPRSEGILSRRLWERTALVGLYMSAGTLFVFRDALDGGAPLEQARTAALTTMVLFQNFHVFNSRSERVSIFRKSLTSNRFLFAATAAALGVHAGAIHLPFLQFALGLVPLEAETWGRMLAVAAGIVVVVELHKLLRRA